MIYFITGITGTVVPVVVENLVQKDKNAFFYFAIRKDAKGTDILTRFEETIDSLDLDKSTKVKVRERSKLVEIDIEQEKMGIEPSLYDELVTHTDKILHGAADVRFDQPYEKIRMPNVVFTEKIYDLFNEIKQYRKQTGQSDATLYYISTGYAYGISKKIIPEDYPEFHPGKPDNTYAQTKAEAKRFILDKIKTFNDRIVIFEPTIIGGSAKTGKTKTYNLHYTVFMLGYLGKLPLLTSPNNQLDIVPVDWVAAIISDIMAKDEMHQGVLRLASGKDAVKIGHLHDVAYNYYVDHDPVPGHAIPKIHFVPKWFFLSMVQVQKAFYRALYLCTRNKRFRKMVKGISLLEGYFPYITGYKVFDNSKSTALIRKYTDCSEAPVFINIVEKDGRLVPEGYYKKILADTLETGWGGMVDFKRLEKQTAVYKETQAAFGYSKK
jgi:thioester reductase-like protein